MALGCGVAEKLRTLIKIGSGRISVHPDHVWMLQPFGTCTRPKLGEAHGCHCSGGTFLQSLRQNLEEPQNLFTQF